jgi:Cd2+/Zn2+-exporting ATPase
MRNGVPCPGCEGEQTQVFQVDGLDCATEALLIEDCLSRLPGVCSVRVAPATGTTTVVHTLEADAIVAALGGAGFPAREARAATGPRPGGTSTWVAAALAAAGFGASALSQPFAIALFLPAILVGGLSIAQKGLARARQGTLDMNVLMTIAVVGAIAIGEWSEGAATVVLFSLAQLLESRSLDRARRAITGLMTLAPETALVRREGREQRVSAPEVRTGEVVIVAPGERLPLDGLVAAGASEVDQSPLTGESAPVAKEPGAEVFAGSINGSGTLTVRVTRRSAETTLARIMRRVEEAQSSRAPTQSFVDRFARVYTPVVVATAVGVALVPPLLDQGSFRDWLYRALVLLVISCPCALVISTPVSIVSALTSASRRGVLIKGGAHLEALAKVRGVVFDKTGTLTAGLPVVTDVLAADGDSPRDVLRAAAAVEARSAHPLGAAVVARAREEGLAVDPAEDASVLAGRGMQGVVAGRPVLVGSHRVFDERGLCDHRMDADLTRLESEGKTAVLVGVDGSGLVGALGVADGVRPEAAGTVAWLRRNGLFAAMLTGDNARTAAAIASRVGIEEWRADLLPEDKVAHVRLLQERHGAAAVVGDGVNDAPALATAAVGIAMGGRGADAVLETADIVLMGDDLGRIPETIRLGRAARRVVGQNVALSLLVKGAVLALALAGHGTLWAAVAADMGASLLVIGNGLRLLKHR